MSMIGPLSVGGPVTCGVATDTLPSLLAMSMRPSGVHATATGRARPVTSGWNPNPGPSVGAAGAAGDIASNASSVASAATPARFAPVPFILLHGSDLQSITKRWRKVDATTAICGRSGLPARPPGPDP